MRLINVKHILVKELKDNLRDRRTLFTMFLPIILYPLILILALQVPLIQQMKLASRTFEVVVTGARGASDLVARIEAAKGFERVDSKDPHADLVYGRVQLVLHFSPDFQERLRQGEQAEYELKYDPANDLSLQARQNWDELLDIYQGELLAERLAKLGKSVEFVQPIKETLTSVAPPEKLGAFYFGKVLALFIVIMALVGAFYPAIDLSAGEKERGTLETLLASPASRGEIILGKYLTVLVISLVVAILNLASMGVTFVHLTKVIAPYGMGVEVSEAAARTINFSIEPASLFWMLLALVPLCGLFAALSLALASYARSTREGQYYLTPLVICVFPATLITTVPGIELTASLALVPVANVALMFKEMMLGIYRPLPIALTFLAMGGYVFFAIRWAVWAFEREEVLFREASHFRWQFWRARAMETNLPRVRHALLAFALVVLLVWFLGQPLLAANPILGYPLVLLGLVLLPPLRFAELLKVRMRECFRFRGPSCSGALVAVVTGLAAHVLAAALMRLVELPPMYEKALEPMLETMRRVGWLGTAVLLGLLPGISEEVMFRGFVLRGLEQSWGVRWAVVGSAILFGLYHLDPYRLPHTTLLGLVMGMMVVSRGSIFIGMITHVTYNLATLFLGAEVFFKMPAWLKSGDYYRLPVVLIAGVLFVMCLAWFIKLPHSRRFAEAT